MFGSIVIGLFSVILLFYTSGALTKHRKREFGLYNVLGMEKRHIVRVLTWETLYTALIALTGGLVGGIVFSKLMQLLLMRLLGCEVQFGMRVDPTAICVTIVVFAMIFLLILLNTRRIIRLSKPVELLRGTGEGEREPKSKWLLAVLGIICIAAGYTLSIMSRSAVFAIAMFFVAVLLVIAGTYFLFTAFSIVFLKGLRKNKKYYYQTRHFATVSGMLYRMKRNAAGLASICILSTMVLVTASTTVCLYLGVDGILNHRYPYDVTLNYIDAPTEEQLQNSQTEIASTVAGQGLTISGEVNYDRLEFAVVRDGDKLIVDANNGNIADYTKATMVWITTADGYKNLTGQTINLGEGEALCYTDGKPFGSTLSLMDWTFSLTQLKSFPLPNEYDNVGIKTCFLVVDSLDTLRAIEQAQQQVYGDKGSVIDSSIRFNLSGTDDQKAACAKTLGEALGATGQNGDSSYSYNGLDSKQIEQQDGYFTFFGAFFFLGMFLGLLFILATVLIIYYKQVSEGYEDRQRFSIMQKVGMTKQEVRATIHSQVLIVFFLPLVTAAVHVAFAFPMIRHILAAFGMLNVSLFINCTLATLFVFAVLYSAVYLLTARTYYGIVSDAGRTESAHAA